LIRHGVDIAFYSGGNSAALPAAATALVTIDAIIE
jgi:hypothetical protein